jgi:hypothetical protein
MYYNHPIIESSHEVKIWKKRSHHLKKDKSYKYIGQAKEKNIEI